MKGLFYIIGCLAVIGVVEANNRAAVCQKAVNLGVTFYTAKELEPILACADAHFYNDPYDPELISINSCTDLMALLEKMAPPFKAQCKPVINKALNTLKKCKENNKKTGAAKQTACMNQVYSNCIAMVTKAFVNKVCTALSKKMNSKEWNCCKQYAPKVVNAKMYECYNIEK
ncbi:hypothetical protein CAEBREN_08872 [Caenorhabditis brenneri]|uniref:DUF19 domain-containing protein n=1 Tax=Caenorhabditis brenneri TaxID=135651 RepID=G0NBL4_CAEBE|nr:hypothetical protein CAEBREN_08872 [Caenorhabditis brenneri]